MWIGLAGLEQPQQCLQKFGCDPSHWVRIIESVKRPARNDYLQRWPVSKRVNSSKADADDSTFIEPVQLAAA